MKKRIVLALALVLGGVAEAQNLNSAYWMDSYVNGHEMNPARELDCNGYFSLPGAGNINAGLGGNLNLNDVLLKNPEGSGLVTYLHPSISGADAMSNFSLRNKTSMDARVDLFNVGFHAFGGYNVLSIAARATANVSAPYELFDATKNLTNKNYHIDKLGVSAQSWIEIGLGHSHQVSDGWRIGAKAKLLLGGAYAKLKTEQLDLLLADENQWIATGKATAEVGYKNFSWGAPEIRQYKSEGRGSYEQINFKNVDAGKFTMNGKGFAVDLGAEWDLGKDDILRGLKVSGSLLDVGFIRWNTVHVAENKGEDFIFNGFQDLEFQDKTSPNTFKKEGNAVLDRLSDLYSLQDQGVSSRRTRLGVTLNLGVDYKLSSCRNIDFGFLSTTRIQGIYTWNEERISMGIKPWKWLDIVASLGGGTKGFNYGWVISAHPLGFNLFVGSDHAMGKLSKQYIPVRSNKDICVGINFPISRRKQ